MIPVRVVADEREKASGVPDKLSKYNVRVYFSKLPVADYVISPEIAVERKSLADFVASIYDGRLFIQSSEISSAYRKPYLMVEGDINDVSKLTRNISSYYGAIASVTIAYDLRIIHTTNSDESAAAITALLRNSRSRPLPPGAFRGPPKSKDLAQQQLFLLSSLPGVGRKLGKRLLARSGTPRKVMSLTESQFAMVPGVGWKRAEKITHLLDANYTGKEEEVPQEKLG